MTSIHSVEVLGGRNTIMQDDGFGRSGLWLSLINFRFMSDASMEGLRVFEVRKGF